MVVGMHGEFLYEQGAHAAPLEIALVHPVIRADDLVRKFCVSDQLVFGALLHLEKELLDPFLFIDLEEVFLQAWALVLDGFAEYVAKDELEELPDSIKVAPMDAPHSQLELWRSALVLCGLRFAFRHGVTVRTRLANAVLSSSS